ncbi:MAG: carbonic anhydrase family protein [Nitrospirota bacterium]|nr:carbonic anhydrase family protein [Nitrospirota bacterium]
MKKFAALLAAASILAGGSAYASGGGHWTYSGNTGPDHWATLDSKFSACAGMNQSPINIDTKTAIEAQLDAVKINYTSSSTEVLNNGHAIQVNFAKGSTITIDNTEFELKQYHLHYPSENTINGESFPMELHLVHADKNGNLAVIGIMFKEGAANSQLAAVWKKMPRKEGEKNALSGDLKATGVLPDSKDYYRFNGSLTTPPCSEGVRWIVMKNPITASKDQIKEFEHTMHHPTNRPVQPVNARPILK